MKTWKGNDLKGQWDVTFKVDGVRAHVDKRGRVTSRNNKPLYNLDHLLPGVYEVYCGSWETTITAVRTKDGRPVPREHVYSLNYPMLDHRLCFTAEEDLKAGRIKELFKRAVKAGYEGLVLWPVGGAFDDALKVKPKETWDVKVTGVIPGKGKHAGRMGALMTKRGKVGTGFTDRLRELPTRRWLGMTIEVEAMGLTPAGKFRHPRFVRVRHDK